MFKNIKPLNNDLIALLNIFRPSLEAAFITFFFTTIKCINKEMLVVSSPKFDNKDITMTE
jgi:hypothetical protein